MRQEDRDHVPEGRAHDGALILLALPAECNFSGARPDLDAVLHAVHGGVLQQRVEAAWGTERSGAPPPHGGACLGHGHERGGDASAPQVLPPGGQQHAGCSAGSSALRGARVVTLLDAAKACATAPPDLSRHPVDFLVLSYYKIFGHPTGLGALVAKRSTLEWLRQHCTGARSAAAAPASATAEQGGGSSGSATAAAAAGATPLPPPSAPGCAAVGQPAGAWRSAYGKAYFGGGTVQVSVADCDFHSR